MTQTIKSNTNELASAADLPDPLSGPWPQLLAALRQLGQAGELHSRRMIRASGLTMPQTLVLIAIRDLERPTVGRISQAVSLSPPTVTTILNRLEERELVRRGRAVDDRRQIMLSLTEAGRGALLAAPSLLPETFVRRFGALAPWEQSLLLSSLQRLAAMMAEAVAETQTSGAGEVLPFVG